MARRTHGMTGTTEYKIWEGIKQRCLNPNERGYPKYGGRGIKVCDEWAASFQAFFDYVGYRPGPEFTIDRIDNDGNYEPGNVRWATARQQSANQRPRRKPEFCKSGQHRFSPENTMPDGRCLTCRLAYKSAIATAKRGRKKAAA